jgi:hypothetical protein
MAKKLPPCGNPDCGCSSGLDEEVTYGSGDLSFYGYWSKPCRICAKYHDEHREEIKEEIRQNMKECRVPDWKIDAYLAEANWINQPAWPHELETTLIKI